jgi:hypothetical protein
MGVAVPVDVTHRHFRDTTKKRLKASRILRKMKAKKDSFCFTEADLVATVELFRVFLVDASIDIIFNYIVTIILLKI